MPAAAAYAADAGVCPFHATKHQQPAPADLPTELRTLRPFITADGDYDRTSESAALLASVGGGQRIREMTTRFYSYAMEDEHLREFFFMDDGVEMAAERLGTWIIQFMGGEGNPWDDFGREGKRQETHARAWFSSKRPHQRRGRRFKLDDCRVWMRLMFLAMRDVGLAEHTAFANWYVQFIAHFVRIYEASAPRFARTDFEWSADERRVASYLSGSRLMTDVVGISY